jgi:hypothetical protein
MIIKIIRSAHTKDRERVERRDRKETDIEKPRERGTERDWGERKGELDRKERVKGVSEKGERRKIERENGAREEI